MKLQKVSEPKNNDITWCERCDQYYCSDCVDFITVDFHVEENVFADRPDLKPFLKDWKGESVCCYCYNQLVDIKSKEKKK